MARKITNFTSNDTFKVYFVAEKATGEDGKAVYLLTDPDTGYLRKNDGLAALDARRESNSLDEFCLFSLIVNPVTHTVTMQATGVDASHAQSRAARGIGIVA